MTFAGSYESHLHWFAGLGGQDRARRRFYVVF
jgi:hypothetical protein